jgi:hypothetical protein
MHILMFIVLCIVLCIVVIAFYRAIWIAWIPDVSMIRIGVEDAHEEEEEPSHHYVAPGMSLRYEPSQVTVNNGNAG